MTRPTSAWPFNPLPWSVWLLLLAILGVEAALQAGRAGWIGGPEALGWRLQAVQRLGFSGAILDWMLENRRLPPAEALRLLAYPLIHADWVHAGFILALVAALGKAVGEVLSGLALLALVLLSSACGALVWGLAVPEPRWLIGGYPMVFGLLGAFTLLLWTDLAARGANRLRALALVGVLLLLRVLLGLWHGGGQEWIADVAACAAGVGLAAVLAPGGGRAMLARLRRR